MRYIFLAAIFILASIVVHAQQSVNEIVFFGGPDMTNTGTQVYSIRADGSGQVNLTNNPAATHLSPNWSPDGTKIVLSINDFIWVMNADGTSNGKIVVTAETEHNLDDTLTGTAVARVYNAAGDLIASRCVNSVGTRFTGED